MTSQLASLLAQSPKSGYVIAPAGFGKTYLIAESVKSCDNKQLILTHTFAGVDSIKVKLRAQDVPSYLYEVDTIASFALKLVKSYPVSCGWSIDEPVSKDDWKVLYEKATQLLCYSFVKRVFSSSYAGTFVDEYQDCSEQQHLLVKAISELKPVRIVGDPLQAIFDFDGQKVVDWEKDIYPNFDKMGELTTPWRWKLAGMEELGQWLFNIRENIAAGVLPKAPRNLKGFEHVVRDLDNVKDFERFNEFRNKAKEAGTCIVVYPGSGQYKNKTHLASKFLSGSYTSIEEIEGKAVARVAEKLMKAKSNNTKLAVVVEFIKTCMTAVAGILPKKTLEGQVAKVSAKTRYPSIVARANCYIANGKMSVLICFIKELIACKETKVYRQDLLSRFVSLLGYALEDTLEEAFKRYKQDFRHSGRRIGKSNQIGTTLLVKGLEYTHCIVAYPTKMTPKEFYVALTRGTHSVTVISEPSS